MISTVRPYGSIRTCDIKYLTVGPISKKFFAVDKDFNQWQIDGDTFRSLFSAGLEIKEALVKYER